MLELFNSNEFYPVIFLITINEEYLKEQKSGSKINPKMCPSTRLLHVTCEVGSHQAEMSGIILRSVLHE